MKFTEALKFIEAAQSNNPEKGKADKRVDANPDSVVDVPVAPHGDTRPVQELREEARARAMHPDDDQRVARAG